MKASLLLLLLPTVAQAYSTGVFGYSGKDGASCTQCHAAGAAIPTVTLAGPTHLAVGEHGTYTFDVVTGATSHVAGLDVAVSGGTLVSLAQNNATFLNNGEISHKGVAKGNTVQWRFELDAPSVPGTLTVFATGLAGNADGNNTGDGVGGTTLVVEVGDPPDLAGVDLAGAMPDLSTVDAVSAASPVEPMAGAKVDLGPPHDERTWACACDVGGRPGRAVFWPLGLGLLVFLLLRYRVH